MTTIAVLVDPPRPGLVLPRLPATSPLSPDEAADLYAAMAADVLRAVEASGGELLVNYRPDGALPERGGEASAESEVRSLATGALDAPEEARFEVQVGETFAGRAGNTVTHLLESEGVNSAAITTPSAAFLGRTQVDAAAMKLRRSPVVLGPAGGGRVYYAAFAGTVDFAGAFAPPAVGTLTDRAREAGHDVDFLEVRPTVETGADLATALALVRARRRADRAVPDRTADCLGELGLELVDDDGLRVTR